MRVQIAPSAITKSAVKPSVTKSVKTTKSVAVKQAVGMQKLIIDAIMNGDKATRVQVFNTLNTYPLHRLFSVLKWIKTNYQRLVKSQAQAAQCEKIRTHVHHLKNRRRLEIVRKERQTKQIQRPRKRTRVREEDENNGDDDMTEAEKLLLDDIGDSEVHLGRDVAGVQVSSVVDLCKSGFLTTYCEYIEPMLLNLSTSHGKELRPIGEFIHSLVDTMLEIAWIVNAFDTGSSSLFFNSEFLSDAAQLMLLKRVEEAWRLYLE
jgi:hypothetical protein